MEVPEGHTGVVTRLGSIRTLVGPGPVQLIPLVDKLVLVDMRPRGCRVGPVEVTCLDDRRFLLGGNLYFQAFDPELVLMTVRLGDYRETLLKLWSMVAQRTASHGTGDELVAQLASVSVAMVQAMNPITEKFGVRISRLELRAERV